MRTQVGTQVLSPRNMLTAHLMGRRTLLARAARHILGKGCADDGEDNQVTVHFSQNN